MTKEKIIITGATGFIGGFIIQEALRLDMAIFCIVRESSDITRFNNLGVNFLYFHPDDSQRLDIEFSRFVAEHGQPDYFIHNAGVTKSLHISDFEKINAGHTKNYAQCAERHFTALKRFLLMSSLAAQGPGNESTFRKISVFDESKPNTQYGLSKLKAEQFLKETTNLPFVILRPTGVYGPREHDYFLYLKTLKNGLEPVLGFKEQHLSFVYVTDLVNAAFLALKAPVARETFIISDGKNYTGTEYGNLARKALGCKAIRIKIALPIVKIVASISEVLGRISGNTPTLNNDKYQTMKALNWSVDIDETITKLNYKPQVDLSEGLQRCVQWYRENGWLS